MTERIVDRLRDRLSENASYEGVVAAGYDSWISVESPGPSPLSGG